MPASSLSLEKLRHRGGFWCDHIHGAWSRVLEVSPGGDEQRCYWGLVHISTPASLVFTGNSSDFSEYPRFQSLSFLPQLPPKFTWHLPCKTFSDFQYPREWDIPSVILPQYPAASFYPTPNCFPSRAGLPGELCEAHVLAKLKGSSASLGTLGMPVGPSVHTVGWSPSALSPTCPRCREHSAGGVSCLPAAGGSNTPGCCGSVEPALAEGRDKAGRQAEASPARLLTTRLACLTEGQMMSP